MQQVLVATARATGGRGAAAPVAALLLALAVCGGATAQQIGLDAAHGYDPEAVLWNGSDFSQLRDEIVGLGFSHEPVGAFDAASLAGLDALLLLIPYAQNAHASYSSAEIAAIESFVAGGGGLIVLGDAGEGSNAASLNALVDSWGVSFFIDTFDPFVGFDPGGFSYGVDRHPVTARAGRVGVDYHRPFFIEAGSSVLGLTRPDPLLGDAQVLAVLEGAGGAGPVVFVSDSTLWNDDDVGANRHIGADCSPLPENSPDCLFNEYLLRNSLRFVLGLPIAPVVPTLPPVGVPLLVVLMGATGGLLLARRARRGRA